jgi:hypothetical protein
LHNNKENSDWTECFRQIEVAEQANKLVDDIIDSIFRSNLQLHIEKEITQFELNLLYRWPIYIGVNIFFERLLRVTTFHENGKTVPYHPIDSSDTYYENTVQSVQAYYYDFSTNNNLLNELSDIFGCSPLLKLTKEEKTQRPQESLKQFDKNKFFKNILKYFFFKSESVFVNIFKPQIIGESSGWFRKLFIFGHSIDFYNHKFSDKDKSIDYATREKIKYFCENVFVSKTHGIINTLSEQQIKQCASLFSQWIDHIIPLSIIEGLQGRFDYYEKMLINWQPKQVHAFTGYYYNENFKIFALLAKRKGAKLVGHTHGANNYQALSYKGSNELRFLDYYTTYGLNTFDADSEIYGAENVVFIPTGSTAFNAVPKWEGNQITTNNIRMLYASGPLMDFMSDLQEISPEKNLEHRLRILQLLDRLLRRYSGLKIYYKPFPGTFTNDPIKTKCSKWLDQGRIELTTTKPQNMYPKVDIVFWDSISTGFAESIVSGAPVVVFNSQYEYNQVSARGKTVNDALTAYSVQCFDIDSAEKSIDGILNDLDGYKKETAMAIQMYKEDKATPVSQKEWHRRFKQGIIENESHIV